MERITRIGPIPGAATWVHLPSDGLEALGALGLPSPLAGEAWTPAMPAVFAGVFGAIALQWAAVWAVSRAVDEPAAVSAARLVTGRPALLRPMETWRGPLGREGFVMSSKNVKLRVHAAYGRRDWLVITRTHVHPLSAGIAAFGVPAEHAPVLRQTIAELQARWRLA